MVYTKFSFSFEKFSPLYINKMVLMVFLTMCNLLIWSFVSLMLTSTRVSILTSLLKSYYLLAQEKKDSFWLFIDYFQPISFLLPLSSLLLVLIAIFVMTICRQRNGKLRPYTGWQESLANCSHVFFVFGLQAILTWLCIECIGICFCFCFFSPQFWAFKKLISYFLYVTIRYLFW